LDLRLPVECALRLHDLHGDISLLHVIPRLNDAPEAPLADGVADLVTAVLQQLVLRHDVVVVAITPAVVGLAATKWDGRGREGGHGGGGSGSSCARCRSGCC